MWFIADIFERYTSNVAKTFIKLASKEAEANRRALDEIRARRSARALLLPEQSLTVRPALLTKETGLLAAGSLRSPSPIVPQRHDLDTRIAAVLAALPSGVRRDVVARWIETFAIADPAEVRELLVRLVKDKKVRVPELQVIVADVLEEAPTFRKKDEHLALLGRHFGLASLRPAAKSAARPAAAGPSPQHA